MLECGHPCGGILDEDPCLPCLHRCRPSDQEALKQDADDMCMICFTEALSAAPAIQVKWYLTLDKCMISQLYCRNYLPQLFTSCTSLHMEEGSRWEKSRKILE